MDTSTSKKYLKQALSSLPSNFALREAKYHIAQAIRQIENIDNKKIKKQQTQAQTWNELINKNVQNPYTSKGTLDTIDKMIEEEKQKLEDLQKAIDQTIPTPDGTLFG